MSLKIQKIIFVSETNNTKLVDNLNDQIDLRELLFVLNLGGLLHP